MLKNVYIMLNRIDQEKELPLQHSQSNDQVKLHFAKVANERNSEDLEHCNEISKLHKHIVEKGMKSGYHMHKSD